MVNTKKSAEKNAEGLKVYEIKITRANELENGTIMFDMIVNGVTIYGCNYKVLTRKDNGEEFAKVGFPSRKGGDRYYNIAYVPINAEALEMIENGIQSLIG